MFDSFASRHIGVNNEKDLQAMLDVIGVRSVDELVSQVIPASIRLKKPLALPREGMSEYAFAAHIRALAERNRPLRSFIGMGYYPCAVPAAVARNVFENPAWYTSYTPYQAEISQGRLEALLNFQTAVISLTGMEIGNCSLLDEGTATAEAMLMMFALRSREAVREGRNQLFVDRNLFPQTLDLLLTRSEPFGIELIIDDYDEYVFTGKEFGAIVQYPAADGAVRDYAAFTAEAHAKGALVTAVADLLALALLKTPGEWGADIVTGSTQRLGTPMGFGGPSAGYMTTREAFKRNMPGRIIGVSVDRLGHRALRMALQMREQHIKRERATSNICTASALMASMVGFYCVYNGAEGLLRAARTAHRAACNTARALEALGYQLANTAFFDTLDVERVEEGGVGELVAQRLEGTGCVAGGAVGGAGGAQQPFGAVVDAVEAYHRGHERRGGADVRGGALALDVLLAHLERHAQGAVTEPVDRDADDAARHVALEGFARGHVAGARTAEAHRRAETLRRARDDVGAPFARGLQQRQCEEVRHGRDKRPLGVGLGREGGVVAHGAVGCGVLDDGAELLACKDVFVVVVDDQFDAERLAAGQEQIEGLREEVAVDEELVAPLPDRLARTQGEHHEHRLGRGRALVEQRAVADLHPRQRNDGRLEVEERLETSLRDLGLVGGVGGVPGGIFEDVAGDGRRYGAGVVAHADEGAQRPVALGQGADVGGKGVFAHSLAREGERLLETDGGGNDLRDELIDRSDADHVEHGLEVFFVVDADMARGKGIEHRVWVFLVVFVSIYKSNFLF